MPRIYLLVGPSGSGKTTYRQRLLESMPDAVVVSGDDILDEWAERDGLSYQDAYAAHSADSKAEVIRRLEAAVAGKRNIIWDQTNLTADIRRASQERVCDSYERIAIAFEAPLGVLLERVFDREQKTGKHVPETVVRVQHGGYQRPHFDEGFDHVVVIHEPSGRQELLS